MYIYTSPWSENVTTLVFLLITAPETHILYNNREYRWMNLYSKKEKKAFNVTPNHHSTSKKKLDNFFTEKKGSS